MQLLTFGLGGEPYAIESRHVVEVLPLVPARPLPGLPDYLLGLITYRGDLVPLVDLGMRLDAGRAAARLSTRVIVVALAGAGDHRLGLVAEHVTAIRSAADAAAALPPLQLEAAPYLGRVLRLGGQTVQLLDVDRILPADLLAGLFPAAGAASSAGQGSGR